MDEFCTFCVCSVSTCDAIWVSFPSPLSDRSDPGGVSNSGGELMIWSVSVKKERKKKTLITPFGYCLWMRDDLPLTLAPSPRLTSAVPKLSVLILVPHLNLTGLTLPTPGLLLSIFVADVDGVWFWAGVGNDFGLSWSDMRRWTLVVNKA